MVKDQEIMAVKDAVYKLQNFLLNGIENEAQLFAAGSIMSRSDYEDVVVERSIANMCGYPLCRNSLPSDRPRKGRYRISLKEHKVYDLHETYMYCSSSCVVNSKAFAGSLQSERCFALNHAKFDEVLRLFEKSALEADDDSLGKDGDLGLSKLMIHENVDIKADTMPPEQSVGPSNAIEGYVPQKERKPFPSGSKSHKEGKKSRNTDAPKKDYMFNEVDFTSAVITNDEYSVSKSSSSVIFGVDSQESIGKVDSLEPGQNSVLRDRSHVIKPSILKDSSGKSKGNADDNLREYEQKSGENCFTSSICELGSIVQGQGTREDHAMKAEAGSGGMKLKPSLKSSSSRGAANEKRFNHTVSWADNKTCKARSDNTGEVVKMEDMKEHPSTSGSDEVPQRKCSVFNDMDFMGTIITNDEYIVAKSSLNGSSYSQDLQGKVDYQELDNPFSQTDTSDVSELNVQEGLSGNSKGKSTGTKLKPSLKSPASRKAASEKTVNRTVTWADEKTNRTMDGNIVEVMKTEEMKEAPSTSGSVDVLDEKELLRFASAEACAEALTLAADAVASGKSDIADAVSETGLIILPQPHDMDDGDSLDDPDMLEGDPVPVKWLRKTGMQSYDLFGAEDSWFDAPPEGFSLTLSPFATMWGALFAWITSSSLAYIYGQDESLHEEYLSVNGREYPMKIVLSDGRSSEIKQTLAGCLARALPGLVADLRLATPVSTLEQGIGLLVDTMSFVDAIPSFRIKQWQVVLLLFFDALSVCRLPALAPHMTNRRALLHKVLAGAQVSVEEYEIMKDLLLPLGRAPRFSAQSGA